MALYLTDISSLKAQYYLAEAIDNLDSSSEKLSSGSRINSASDDAAGLSISDRLTSQINGLNQGNENCEDGIALCQTVEGALDEITEMLQRIRTLAVQSANGTYTDDDREALQAEADALSEEITRTACQTTYAGETILNGIDGVEDGDSLLNEDGKIVLQVGANAGDTISVDLSDGFTLEQILEYCGIEIGADSTGTFVSLDGTTLSISSAENAEATLGVIDQMISYVDIARAKLGATETRLESAISSQTTTATNESEAKSQITDTDYAEEATTYAEASIQEEAAAAMLTQANARGELILTLIEGATS